MAFPFAPAARTRQYDASVRVATSWGDACELKVARHDLHIRCGEWRNASFTQPAKEEVRFKGLLALPI
jgi:hypothetical protein